MIEVSHFLVNMKKEQLRVLGQILGLFFVTVNNHWDHTLQEYRDSIIRAWLLKCDNVKENGGPSWITLQKALRHELLRETGIADKIVRKLLALNHLHYTGFVSYQ